MEYSNKLAGKNVFLFNFLHDKYNGDGKNLAIAKSLGEKYDSDESRTHTAAQKILTYSSKRSIQSTIIIDPAYISLCEQFRNIDSATSTTKVNIFSSDDDFLSTLDELSKGGSFGNVPHYNLLVVTSTDAHIAHCRKKGFLTCKYSGYVMSNHRCYPCSHRCGDLCVLLSENIRSKDPSTGFVMKADFVASNIGHIQDAIEELNGVSFR